MFFVLKSLPWERPGTARGFQTPRIVASQLIKNFLLARIGVPVAFSGVTVCTASWPWTSPEPERWGIKFCTIMPGPGKKKSHFFVCFAFLRLTLHITLTCFTQCIHQRPSMSESSFSTSQGFFWRQSFRINLRVVAELQVSWVSLPSAGIVSTCYHTLFLEETGKTGNHQKENPKLLLQLCFCLCFGSRPLSSS